MSLWDDLEEAQRGLEQGLGAARHDEAQQSLIVSEFQRELVRICRADSRLLMHPIASKWIQQARGFGMRNLLRKMHRGLEKGVKGPRSAADVSLWAEIDRRRPASLEAIRRALVAKGLISRDLGERGFRKRAATLDEP